jgi:hypothetical protein
MADDGVAATRERRGQEGTRGVCRRHAARVMMSLCLEFDCAGLPSTVRVAQRDRHLLPLAGTYGPPDLPFLPSLGVNRLSPCKTRGRIRRNICQRHHFQRHHFVASSCETCKPQRNPQICLPLKGHSFAGHLSRQNLICSTQSICATSSLACPVSLCYAHDCRSPVATRCCDPRSRFLHVPATLRQTIP